MLVEDAESTSCHPEALLADRTRPAVEMSAGEAGRSSSVNRREMHFGRSREIFLRWETNPEDVDTEIQLTEIQIRKSTSCASWAAR